MWTCSHSFVLCASAVYGVEYGFACVCVCVCAYAQVAFYWLSLFKKPRLLFSNGIHSTIWLEPNTCGKFNYCFYPKYTEYALGFCVQEARIRVQAMGDNILSESFRFVSARARARLTIIWPIDKICLSCLVLGVITITSSFLPFFTISFRRYRRATHHSGMIAFRAACADAFSSSWAYAVASNWKRLACAERRSHHAKWSWRPTRRPATFCSTKRSNTSKRPTHRKRYRAGSSTWAAKHGTRWSCGISWRMCASA